MDSRGDPSLNTPLTVSRSERFLQEIEFYQAIYVKSQSERQRKLTDHLLDVGELARSGAKAWSRSDLDDIASWKGLPPGMLMVKMNSSDFEARLASALKIEDEPLRVNALCGIQGIGLTLGSLVLMFTWPENYGFMDYHTCSALRSLNFEFPRKYSASRFTVPQLLTYLKIIRRMGRKPISAMTIAEGLYVLDNLATKAKPLKTDAKSSLQHFGTPMSLTYEKQV